MESQLMMAVLDAHIPDISRSLKKISKSLEDSQKEQKEQNRFPNGFDSWQETHFEMVEGLIGAYDSGNSKGEMQRIFEDEGRGGMYELAKKLTFEFEEQFKGIDWGVTQGYENWFDSINNWIEYTFNKLNESNSPL